MISPTITTGASSTSFYYIMNNPGSFTITADDGASLTDASLSVQAVASSGTVKFKLLETTAELKAASTDLTITGPEHTPVVTELGPLSTSSVGGIFMIG